MKSALLCAQRDSLIFAPIEVPLLPIWFEIIDSRCCFNFLTRSIIATANFIDKTDNLSSFKLLLEVEILSFADKWQVGQGLE